MGLFFLPPDSHSLLLGLAGPDRGALVYHDVAVVLDGNDACAVARGARRVGVPSGLAIVVAVRGILVSDELKVL